MAKCIAICRSFCGFLLLLASCAGPISKPRGYGEMLPGETWVAVDDAYQSQAREMVYYDPKTIRRDGDRVTMWQLIDYKWMQGNAPFGMFTMGPHRFLSTKTHKQFDCVRNTVRLLASSEFSRHMGTGIQNAVLVEEGSGRPVELGSANHGLWEVACGVTMTSK